MSTSENASIALAEEVIRSFGEIRLRVLGTSMAPSVLPGDVVSIERAELQDISWGEIVLFSRNGRLFVHRAVWPVRVPDSACLITRGDRLRHDDPPISRSEFLGRVTSIERAGRTFKPESELKGWARAVRPVLRTSHFITRVYLRLLTLARFGAKGSSFRSEPAAERPWAL